MRNNVIKKKPLTDLKELKGEVLIEALKLLYHGGYNIDGPLAKAHQRGSDVSEVLECLLVGGERFLLGIGHSLEYFIEGRNPIELHWEQLKTEEGRWAYKALYGSAMVLHKGWQN